MKLFKKSLSTQSLIFLIIVSLEIKTLELLVNNCHQNM